MACREEDIPEVGDTLVYDICDLSILVVRSPGQIKAYYNACLHRGRRCKEHDGNNTELRCAFHGFCWNLDGSLKQVPATWDFPHVDPRRVVAARGPGRHLGRLRVHQHGPRRRVAGVVPRRLRRALQRSGRWSSGTRRRTWPRSSRPTGRSLQEAFMEAFHVVATHPQLLAGIGDANSQYDWHGNFTGRSRPTARPARTSSSSRPSRRCSTR